MKFGDSLWNAMRMHGPVCVGIDPHPSLLRQWGLEDNPDGLRTFSLRVVEALGPVAAALKPQSAFFERMGSAGIAVLEEVLVACREVNVLSILDVKRGDIGSTMAGYADAYLLESSPLAADAITLSPYLGVGSLKPALNLADETGRGVFVLALTSNPEGSSVQHASDVSGRSVAGGVVEYLSTWNNACENHHMASGGVVVGATIGSAARELGIDLTGLKGPILAPGFGAQGATSAQVKEVFGGCEERVLASTSRAVLSQGPHAEDLRKAYADTVGELRTVLHQ